MHVPAGVLNGVLLIRHPVLGSGLLLCFLAYEALQCWRTHDLSYKDVLGHLVGLALCGIGIVVLEAVSCQ